MSISSECFVLSGIVPCVRPITLPEESCCVCVCVRVWLSINRCDINFIYLRVSGIGQTEKYINPLNAELNPICHLLALLGAHHIFHVSGLRVKKEIKKELISQDKLNVYNLRLFADWLKSHLTLDVLQQRVTTRCDSVVSFASTKASGTIILKIVSVSTWQEDSFNVSINRRVCGFSKVQLTWFLWWQVTFTPVCTLQNSQKVFATEQRSCWSELISCRLELLVCSCWSLTLIVLMWRIGWAHNNARK